MSRGLGTFIWLCWILSSLLPLVQCQGGNGPDSNPFSHGRKHGPFGDGKGGFGHGNRGGGFGGGFHDKGDNRFGNGGGQGAGSQNAALGGSQSASGSDTPGEQAPPADAGSSTSPTQAVATVVAPSTPLDVAPASTAASYGDDAALPPEVLSSSVALPISASAPIAPVTSAPVFVPPLSVTDAFGETSTPVAAIPVFASSSDSNFGILSSDPAATQTDLQSPLSPSATFTSTTTMMMTIMVTQSPAATSALDFAPVPSNSAPPMSASAKAGMGVGVTFGILSVAGAAGFYLWRRRQNRHYARQNSSNGGGLGGFFNLNWKGDKKGKDDEWEIASAEKVEIVRGASARTLSRSDSRSTAHPTITPTPPSSSGNGGRNVGPGAGMEVLKVGMKVPDRKLIGGDLGQAALRSNPPGPAVGLPVSPSAFPSPPSSRGSGVGGTLATEKKTNSWPLPE
ncbi:hypothetical protein K491DRAFT_673487 [Lophiostoma macrostomum CBS 122681]|uniref:Mid2 domain-containing protein n=1 Tax=Lophiostoma macrostomum CBS 122681 TaxID=1314788 RepID=A0A6A6TSS9_9PLEO|nr:hypothetical protein K491DRAFT_673487 [Lophiostoma macrostomum CBS 122681]